MQASGQIEAGGKLYLRVRVQGGGCSGFQNKLDLDAKYDEKTDHKFEFHGIEVVVDKRSMLYLNGAVVDFHDDLNKQRLHHHEPASQEHLRLRQFVQHVRLRQAAATRPVIRLLRQEQCDYFDRLGLPRRFSIDAAELERAYSRGRGRFTPITTAGVGRGTRGEPGTVGRGQRGV